VKRLSTWAVAALIVAFCGLRAVAQTGTPAADFGSPPSGQVPILYNDHHVYGKPDINKQGRVLAALVKDGTLLIPLRSMFEQMGATVSWDGASKTATVSKPGAEVKVTVGKPEVVINGESRPLDVPPMIYQGTVVVPVRVISEGMGAYVLWVPDRKLVVVRYIPATPPPAPPPPAPPPPPPPPAPTPHPRFNEAFVAGDYIISPKVYNEFSPGNTGNSSFAVRGAGEFDLGNVPLMLEGTYERYQYPHNCNGFAPGTRTYVPECYVTTIGGAGSSPVTVTSPLYDQDAEVRFAVRVVEPRVYLGVGYMWVSGNYGYPNMNSFGFGAEKLPDLNNRGLTYFGSVWYYPNVNGSYANTTPNPAVSSSYRLGYNILKYQVGIDYVIGNSPVFVDLGWMGDNWSNKQNAPINRTYNGPFAGIGVFTLYP
jgi:hypothetical protein